MDPVTAVDFSETQGLKVLVETSQGTMPLGILTHFVEKAVSNPYSGPTVAGRRIRRKQSRPES
jgi:hypothetical protein